MKPADINKKPARLNDGFRLPYLPDLIARKTGGPEQSTLTDADLAFHEAEYLSLRGEPQSAHEASRLIEVPSAETRSVLDE